MSKSEQAPESVGGVSRRGALTSSPIAKQEKLIHMLAGRVQDYLHFPVADPLYLTMGAVAGNMLKGVPLWIVLIGAPSSGRTVMLQSLENIRQTAKGSPGVHIIGACKTPGSLLSGTNTKDMTKYASGGILRQTGSRGILVMKDFTSMLSLGRDNLNEMIGAFREIYDGTYSRPLGSDGGKNLEWKGRLGFMAACTPALDRFSQSIGDLGERWLYYRYPETDGYGETIKALGSRDEEAMMEDLKGLVENFITDIGITWDEPRRELTSWEKNRLYAIASLITTARSGVPRDPFRNYEIMDVAHKEAPPRMAKALGQLYLGLERIGLEQDASWRIIGKVGLDSVRQLRMNVLLALYANQGPMHPDDLKLVVKCGVKIMENLLEDLSIHGLIEVMNPLHDRMGQKARNGAVQLTDWAGKQFELAFTRTREIRGEDVDGEEE